METVLLGAIASGLDQRLNPVNLSAIASGSGGFVIIGKGLGESSGFSVASAGDVNGDGPADLLIGAPGDLTGSDPGRSDVVFGKSSTGAMDLAAEIGRAHV